jgi:anaerobic magnesium-protoporphyrin IX monomethyl ester cyclase
MLKDAGVPGSGSAGPTARRPRFLLLAMPLWDVSSPPLSLAYVASLVRSAGWECRVDDVNLRVYHWADEHDRPVWKDAEIHLRRSSELEELYRRYQIRLEAHLAEVLTGEDFRLVGFSVTQPSRFFTQQAARFLSGLRPDLPILFGGSDCFPGEHGRRYFEGSDRAPHLLLQGEAEIALPRFLQEFAATGRSATRIPGFLTRRGGDLTDTGLPDLPDLKVHGVVADYSAFDFTGYLEPWRLSTFFTRGCVNRCAFCNERGHFRRFRVRDPRQVVAEIANALPFTRTPNPGDPVQVRFNDSLFNGSRRDVERLCDALSAQALNIVWGVQASFSVPFGADLFARLYRAGCRSLFWGLESASQPVLDRMRKAFRLDDARRMLREAQDSGLDSHLPLIVGFPGETPADVLADLRFIREFRPEPRVHFLYVSPVVIQENSELHARYRDYGILAPEAHGWSTADGLNTRDVRVWRMFLLGNAIFNPSGEWGTRVHADVIGTVDLNAPAVARELAETWLLLGEERGAGRAAADLLDGWDGEPLPGDPRDWADWRPQGPAGIRWENWFGRDKNSPAVKERVLRGFLAQVRVPAPS